MQFDLDFADLTVVVFRVVAFTFLIARQAASDISLDGLTLTLPASSQVKMSVIFVNAIAISSAATASLFCSSVGDRPFSRRSSARTPPNRDEGVTLPVIASRRYRQRTKAHRQRKTRTSRSSWQSPARRPPAAGSHPNYSAAAFVSIHCCSPSP